MKKNMQVYFDDILDSILLIEEYVKDLTPREFENSDQLQDAVFRRLGIIGEAASQIPDEIREKHPEIIWHRIIGLRNVLIHEYKKVDLNRIWDTLQKDLPKLKKQIQNIKL